MVKATVPRTGQSLYLGLIRKRARLLSVTMSRYTHIPLYITHAHTMRALSLIWVQMGMVGGLTRERQRRHLSLARAAWAAQFVPVSEITRSGYTKPPW